MTTSIVAARHARDAASRKLKALEKKGQVKLGGIGLGRDAANWYVRVLLSKTAVDTKALPASVEGVEVRYKTVLNVRPL